MYAKKILFLGTHGQHNIGDELLLETFLSQLGKQHRYCINSYNPAFTGQQLTGKYNVQIFHTTRNKWQLPLHILQSDLLFFGGGSIIKELYQSVGRNRYSTLLMILILVTFARLLAHKPIIMSNIGVGPLLTRPGHFLAKLILKQVDYLSVRDQKSYNTCLDLELSPGKVNFVPDAVFAHDAAFFIKDKPEHNDSAGTGALKIALNLNFNIENPTNWDNFINSLAQSLRQIHQQQPIEIHALPMQSRFKSRHDLEVLTEFRHKIPQIDMVLHKPLTPQDVGQIIAACDIVLAERLHTLITAAILSKPFLALIYDVKVNELVKILNMETFAVDINRPFNPLTLANKLLNLVSFHSYVSSDLTVRSAQLRRQLRDYFQLLRQQITAKDQKYSSLTVNKTQVIANKR